MDTKYYMICAQPRTGTHFLTSLMSSIRVGNPSESLYYLLAEHKKTYIDNIETLYDRGLKDGVWGATVHWHTYTPGVEKLKEISGFGKDTDDFEVLNHIFPGVKFIYFYRLNKIKQAISRMKANQSKLYAYSDSEKKKIEYKYSREGIIRNMVKISRTDAHWMNFFEKYNIVPHFLTYESLCENKVKSISDILDFLGIQFIFDISLEDHLNNIRSPQRQYDAINEEWYQKFLKT